MRLGGRGGGEENPIAHFCDVSRTIHKQRHAVKKIFLGMLALIFILRSLRSASAAARFRPQVAPTGAELGRAATVQAA